MWWAGRLSGIFALTIVTGCGKWADDLVCGDQGCDFTRDEWTTIQSLGNVTKAPPRPDPSNMYLPIVGWRTRAVARGASADLDGTLVAKPWTSVPEVSLGWRLYFDPRLSGSATNVDAMGLPAPSTRSTTCGQVNVSCASCHDPQRFGADFTSVPNYVSIGSGWEDTNSQQTLNVARFPVFAWDGETDALWAEAAEVIESPLSMNGHRAKTFWVIVKSYWADYAAIFANAGAAAAQDLAARLVAPADTAATAAYQAQYASLSAEDQQTITRVHVNASKAIAAYEWLLSSDGSAFDQFVTEGPQSQVLSAPARRGLKLFVGRASCIDCHNTPMFSDGRFHNVDVPQVGDHVPTEAGCVTPQCNCTNGGRQASCAPWGAYAAAESLPDEEFRRGTAYDDNTAANANLAASDAGVSERAEPSDRLIGAWRTPSLRDVAMTAPYMHDGAYKTLDEVVSHYDHGGGEVAIGTSELSPLTLSAQDRADLVAFLQSLTGTPGPSELLDPPDPDVSLAPDAGCAPGPDGGAGAGP